MVEKLRAHALIVSDIHLGSSSCNAGALLELLERACYERLVIVGDLFESKEALSDEQFRIISFLRDNRHKVICLDGNHDPAEEGLVCRILGIRVVREYEWQAGGRKFCALHGHRFDKLCFVFSEPLIDRVFCWAVRLLKRVRMFGYGAVEDLHQRLSLSFARKAVRYARKRGADAVICGHTHDPIRLRFMGKSGREIEYVNCGAWVDGLCSFVTVDERGAMTLHRMR